LDVLRNPSVRAANNGANATEAPGSACMEVSSDVPLLLRDDDSGELLRCIIGAEGDEAAGLMMIPPDAPLAHAS